MVTTILENLSIFLDTSGKTQVLKRYFLFILTGSLSGLFLRFLLQAELEQPAWSFLDWAYWALLGLALADVVLWGSRWLDDKFGWQQRPGMRWLLGWLGNSLAAALTGYLGFLVFQGLISARPFDTEEQWALLLKGGVILAFLVLSYSVMYFAFYSYRYYGQLRLSKLQEERQRMDLQWQSLRAQLKPHFLFNNLNTISALLGEEEKRAETFIRKLANTYRFMLRSYEEALIPVQREMKLVESYFFLLQTRYPDSLQLDVKLSEEARQKKVPPLAIQLLVENAVKHNQFSPDQPLHILVEADDVNLRVQNDLRPRSEKPKESFAIGLENLRSRYALLQAEQPEVIQNNVFMVKIPLLS